MRKKLLLGVNIDHVATLRQARKESFPDVVEAAKACERAGADQITVHLREDRRHVQDKDVFSLRKVLKKKLNLEMACYKEIICIARKVKPDQATLVPEKRQEVTTEGGLDIIKNLDTVARTVEKLNQKGITVSLFIDPEFDQIEMAVRTGAQYIEIHTGSYANARGEKSREIELRKCIDAAAFANALGMGVNAGHGIDYENIKGILRMPYLHELNIGFSLVSKALFTGLEKAVRVMVQKMKYYKE